MSYAAYMRPQPSKKQQPFFFRVFAFILVRDDNRRKVQTGLSPAVTARVLTFITRFDQYTSKNMVDGLSQRGPIDENN